ARPRSHHVRAPPAPDAVRRRRRRPRLRRGRGHRRQDEPPVPRGRLDRLRRHHREAGVHHRQPQRGQQLRLRRLLPL
ncbi:MAG: Iron-sulfur cluster insertion protein SCO2161, partial [uncultured Pseudonocardia sp.]